MKGYHYRRWQIWANKTHPNSAQIQLWFWWQCSHDHCNDRRYPLHLQPLSLILLCQKEGWKTSIRWVPCQISNFFCFTESPPPGARQQMINSVLEERAEIPFIIIASVSVAGIFLLILNVVLLYCFIQNRKTENIKDNLSLGTSMSLLHRDKLIRLTNTPSCCPNYSS